MQTKNKTHRIMLCLIGGACVLMLLAFFALTQNTKTLTYTDSELGITFSYPENWGKVIIKRDFITAHLMKTLQFSKQSNLKFVAPTRLYHYPAWFEDQGIFMGDSASSFCTSQIYYLTPGERMGETEQEKNDSKNESFRQNGYYHYGNCDANIPFLYRAQKEPIDASASGWNENEEIATPGAFMKLSKRYYWKLQNGIFPSLTLIAETDSFYTDEACLWTTDVGADHSRPLFSYSCMNHTDKQNIERAWKNFEKASFAKKLNRMAMELTTQAPIHPEQNYEENFAQTKKYEQSLSQPFIYAAKEIKPTDEVNQRVYLITFDYPKVFGRPLLNQQPYPYVLREDNKITFHGDDEGSIFKIALSFYDEILKHEGTLCSSDFEGGYSSCWFPVNVNKALWQKERALLAQNTEGTVPCPSETDEGTVCTVEKTPHARFIVRYLDGGKESVQKEYITYTGDMRASVKINPDDPCYTYTDWPSFSQFNAPAFNKANLSACSASTTEKSATARLLENIITTFSIQTTP